MILQDKLYLFGGSRLELAEASTVYLPRKEIPLALLSCEDRNSTIVPNSATFRNWKCLPTQTLDFLLDRANIHDTVTKLYMYADMQKWDELQSEVLADKLLFDYTRLFGGEARIITASELIGKWKPVMERMDGTQHVVTSLVINLPQPGPEIPNKALVVGNVMVHLTQKGAEGGPNTSNGGRYEVEVARFAGSWKISGLTAIPAWRDGNPNILH